MKLDKNQLEEIRKRLENAQPGPWTNNYNGWKTKSVSQPPPNGYGNHLRIRVANCSVSSWGERNAEFIANARQDIPYLLEVIDELILALETK